MLYLLGSDETPIMEKIVFLLRDHEELSIDAIKYMLSIEENDLKRVLKFFADFRVVEVREKNKIRLTKLFREFLKTL